jgi:hypothetical protein
MVILGTVTEMLARAVVGELESELQQKYLANKAVSPVPRTIPISERLFFQLVL